MDDESTLNFVAAQPNSGAHDLPPQDSDLASWLVMNGDLLGSSRAFDMDEPLLMGGYMDPLGPSSYPAQRHVQHGSQHHHQHQQPVTQQQVTNQEHMTRATSSNSGHFASGAGNTWPQQQQQHQHHQQQQQHQQHQQHQHQYQQHQYQQQQPNQQVVFGWGTQPVMSQHPQHQQAWPCQAQGQQQQHQFAYGNQSNASIASSGSGGSATGNPDLAEGVGQHNANNYTMAQNPTFVQLAGQAAQQANAQYNNVATDAEWSLCGSTNNVLYFPGGQLSAVPVPAPAPVQQHQCSGHTHQQWSFPADVTIVSTATPEISRSGIGQERGASLWGNEAKLSHDNDEGSIEHDGDSVQISSSSSSSSNNNNDSNIQLQDDSDDHDENDGDNDSDDERSERHGRIARRVSYGTLRHRQAPATSTTSSAAIAASSQTRAGSDTVPTLRFRGVSWHKRDQRWISRVWRNRHTTHCGAYRHRDIAAAAVDLQEIEMDRIMTPNFPGAESRRIALIKFAASVRHKKDWDTLRSLVSAQVLAEAMGCPREEARIESVVTSGPARSDDEDNASQSDRKGGDSRDRKRRATSSIRNSQSKRTATSATSSSWVNGSQRSGASSAVMPPSPEAPDGPELEADSHCSAD
mmetsp:Transcript_8675/g.27694  ORF Transcript_8675/g.27694 Transcript_8675/m.27694 type:complete len:632 (-) Transcript_8675:220-2115(-)